MEFAEFHNGLRVLLNIDQDEFTQAIWPDHDGSPPPEGSTMRGYWENFRDNPYRWFIRAPDEQAQAVFRIIEKRTR